MRAPCAVKEAWPYSRHAAQLTQTVAGRSITVIRSLASGADTGQASRAIAISARNEADIALPPAGEAQHVKRDTQAGRVFGRYGVVDRVTAALFVVQRLLLEHGVA